MNKDLIRLEIAIEVDKLYGVSAKREGGQLRIIIEGVAD